MRYQRRMLCVSQFILLFIPLIPCTAQISFTQTGLDRGLSLPRACHGSGFFDFNGDGWEDVFIVHNVSHSPMGPQPHVLAKNLGNGYFRDIADSAGVTGYDVSAQGFTAADYDNDGDIDLLIGKGNVYPTLYRNNGNQTFSDRTIQAGLQTYNSGRNVGFWDYDNDGWLDALIVGDDRNDPLIRGVGLYRNNHDGTFTLRTDQAGLEHPRDGSDMHGWAIADFDNDGDQDIYFSNNVTKSRMYRNEGDGTFTQISGESGLPFTDGYRGATPIDYNNDGWFDLFIRGPGDNVSLYRNNKDNTFTDVSNSAFSNRYMNNDLSPYHAALNPVDFDNDGYIDVLCMKGPDSKLFRNNGNGTFSNVINSAFDVLDEVRGWTMPMADYNDDGYVDIFMARGSVDYLPVIFDNDGGTNHWLHLKLEGIQSNTCAIGSRLLCYAGGRLQMQQVSGGLGGMVNSYPVEFGLGDAVYVDSLVIHWPSGLIQRKYEVPVDTFLVVEEGDSSYYMQPTQIEGHVLYSDGGVPVPGVDITITGEESLNDLTDSEGFFQFLREDGLGASEMVPSKAHLEDAADAVSAYDASLVARHMMDLESLAEDRKWYADADEDGRITMVDAVFIARAAVGMPSFPGTSAGDWIFDPEKYTYANLSGIKRGQDFTAKLKGDVNGDWTTLFAPQKTMLRNAVVIPDTIRFGDEGLIRVPITVSDTTQFISFDLRARYDREKIELVDVELTELMEDHDQVYRVGENGTLKYALFGAERKQTPGQLFTMVFRVHGPKDGVNSIDWERFMLDAVPVNGCRTVLCAEEASNRVPLPSSVRLDGYPNPFNPEIVLEYEIGKPATVSIVIYNIMGNPVRRLPDVWREEGKHSTVWDGKGENRTELPGGLYIARMVAGNEIRNLKLVKMK